MFEIRVLPSSELTPDGERLGTITIGDFSERFACYAVPNTLVDDLPSLWKDCLCALTRGASAVALVHDPRFAWIVYREGDRCYVQQRLAIDGNFSTIPARETKTEDGVQISEWPVSLQAIAEFTLS
jgi:hypothetical protein